jgi:hypothetical protein
MSKALRPVRQHVARLQPSSNDGTDECLRTVTAPGTPVTAPQMLRRYGAARTAPGHAGPTTASWPETRDTGCDCDAVCHGPMPSTVPVDAYNRHPVHSGGRRCYTRIQ